MTQNNRKQLFALALLSSGALLVLSSACGWGYAAETYRPKSTNEPAGQVKYVRPEPTVNTEVVKKDPCEVQTFMLFHFDQQFRQTKEMACQTGKILSLTRNDMTNDDYRNLQMQNLPPGQWYVLVDPNNPTPADRKVISNDNLLGLSKVYQLKYFQKMANTGYIIYTFNDPNGAVNATPQ